MARPHKRQTDHRVDVTHGLVARFSPITDPDGFGDLWQQVEAQADGSVFQSWAWLGCRFAARFDDPLALRIMDGEHCVAIGLLNRQRRWSGPRWYLHETGDAESDSVFIEHNGPLVARDCPAAREAWFAALLQAPVGPGRIIVLSGIGADDLAAARRHGVVSSPSTRVAPRRDLAELRRRGMDCLDAVSANTRQQINRAWRRYEASGPILVERATSVGQAGGFITGLAALHQATWQGRGKSGAFASDAFRAFHEDLLGRGVETGMVDLLRISAGSRLIGYLYTLVWRGGACAYQSGFVYETEHPHEKPGLVCHVAAMRHYQARGLDDYDFLAGEDRYKTSLAGDSVALHWVSAAPRPTLAGVVLTARGRLAQWRGG
jgi:CelD/BcsL family acetyltransferase involved in cellulose biosynthesis